MAAIAPGTPQLQTGIPLTRAGPPLPGITPHPDTFTFDSDGGGTIDFDALLWRTSTFVTTGGSKHTVSGDRFNMQHTFFSIYTVANGPDTVDLQVSVRHDRWGMVKNANGVLTLTDTTNNMSQAGNAITINAGTLAVADSGRLNSGSYARDIAINNAGAHIQQHSDAITELQHHWHRLSHEDYGQHPAPLWRRQNL